MTIQIEQETDEKLDIPYEEIIRQVVEEALDFYDCPYESEVDVLLTDDTGIQQINKENRGMDSPTDVLSFPLVEYQTPGDFSHLEELPFSPFHPDSGELMLGDIVLSIDKIREQAEKYGHSTTRELAFLTAHSMLHLFGYDHMEEDDRMEMEEKQNALMEKLGILR